MQQLAAYAERFLQEHDLPGFEYRIESAVGSSAHDYSVRLVPLVSGLPLYENDPTNSRVWVVLDAQGDVWHLFYDTMVLKFITELPVRPASEVWSQICGGGPQAGVLFTTYDSTGRIDAVHGAMPMPREETSPTDLSVASGQVDLVAILYYAFDLRLASTNAYPTDTPVRFVQPAWRFSGFLDSGKQFDILASALQDRALQLLSPPG